MKNESEHDKTDSCELPAATATDFGDPDSRCTTALLNFRCPPPAHEIFAGPGNFVACVYVVGASWTLSHYEPTSLFCRQVTRVGAGKEDARALAGRLYDNKFWCFEIPGR